VHELDVVNGLRDAVFHRFYDNAFRICQVSLLACCPHFVLDSNASFFLLWLIAACCCCHCHFRRKTLGVKIFGSFAVISFVIACVVTLKHQFMPSFDVLLFTGTELYIAPWTRITPYTVGVFCGWFLERYKPTISIPRVSNTDLDNSNAIAISLFSFNDPLTATAHIHVLSVHFGADCGASLHHLA